MAKQHDSIHREGGRVRASQEIRYRNSGSLLQTVNKNLLEDQIDGPS